MQIDARGAAGSWFIGVAAVGLLVWAVADFVRLGVAPPITIAQAPAAAEIAHAVPVEAVELHRLLPDATDDLGTRVRLDGTVVGAVTGSGFWVRDLRDNVVFVAAARGGGSAGVAGVRPGDAVRVVGSVELLSPAEQQARFAAAGLVLPETALVVRDIKVVPSDGGVERLEE